MYSFSFLLLLIAGINALAMEQDESMPPSASESALSCITPDLTIDPNTETDIVTLWAQLNCISNGTYADPHDGPLFIKKFTALKILTTADYPLLTPHQKTTWKMILKNNAKKAFRTSIDTCTSEIDQNNMEKVLDEIENYVFKVNEKQLQLNAITWAQEQIKNKDINIENGTISWPKKLQLKEGENGYLKNAVVYSNDSIRALRLNALENKKVKTQKKLAFAELLPPATLSLKTAEVGTIWNSLFKTNSPTESIFITSPSLKAHFAYCITLLKADSEWLTGKQKEYVTEIIKRADQKIWADNLYSRHYYRYEIAAIAQAEKNVQNDLCQNLSWITEVMPKQALDNEIPYPSAEELKNKRLAALALQKDAMIKMFYNFEKRAKLRESVNSSGECVII